MEIPEIHIPDVHIPYTYVPDYGHSNVQVIGCTYYHRDTKNTGNRNLLIEDPNGVVSNCPYPSYNPLNYVPDQLIITEEMPNLANESEMPVSETPQPEIPKDKKEETEYEPCPPRNAPFMQGDYRNDKKIQRLVKWERGTDGVSCDPIWEKVPYRESLIGTPEVLVSTFVIGLVAGGSAILVPIIQGAAKAGIKNIGKRLSKSKASKNESEE
ncbi:hypothetical protein [uncultured Mediterranean phage uvMED]|nr:hypothetical protein [uncultured Mediterranean phage uvMED]